MRAALIGLSFLLACGGAQRAPVVVPATLAITSVRVFDGEKVWPRADVLVDGDRVVAIGEKLTVPAGAEIVDGTGKTLLPGLIDAHAHVWDGSHLEQSLAFGVTTVLDMFAKPEVARQLREENRPERADLRSAGYLATPPGGHGTEYGFEIPTIVRPEEAQAFVDARFAEGSDYLKIVFDDYRAFGTEKPTVSEATLRALVAAAHARGKLAVVHVSSYAEALIALDSGADGLVHLFRDRSPEADFGARAAGKRAFVTPTLAVLRTLVGKPSPLTGDATITAFLGPDARANLTRSFAVKAASPPEAVPAAIKQLHAAGVPILVGTDAPNAGTTHGATMHDELVLLVEAGLPATEALAGATTRAAGRFGLTDRGRIAAGMRADLLLVDGDPTRTILDSRRIVAVWRAGAKFDRAAYQARLPKEAPPGAGPSAGPISGFDDGTLAARFGQAWVESTDSMVGGKSAVSLKVVDQALAIDGEVVPGGRAMWAGAMFSPGPRPFAATDLSAASKLSFRARGDGKTYVVMVFAQKRGRAPAMRTFTAGKAFAEVSFAWSDFDGLDGKDVMGILIGQVSPGKFSLVVDDVALR